MKFLRTVSLIALAVALSVGFFASDAQAAVLDSVRVVTPDSGVVRGIDSVIVAQVYLRSTSADSSIATYVWMANKTTNTDVLVDGSGGVIPDSIETAIGTAITPPAFVAARAPLQKGYFLTAAGVMDTTKVGDADSVAVKAGPAVAAGKSWIVEFHIKTDADVGTVDNISVWAVVWDINGAGTGFSSIKAAKVPNHGTTWATKIDGDRPSQLTLSLNTVEARGGVTVNGFTKAGEPAAKTVLGIGDTVKIEYDLGSAGDAIILTGDLTMSAQLDYGTPKTIPLGTIQSKVDSAFVVVADEQFPNISVASAYGQVSLFLTDGAGNLSSSSADDPVPTGLTKAAMFVIDAKKPALDAAVAAGDTILPVDNDTITDGGVRAAYEDDRNPVKYNLGEDLRKLTIVFDNADNAKDRTLNITAATPYAFANAQLGAGLDRTLDMTKGTVTSGTGKNLDFRVMQGVAEDRPIAGAQISSGVSALVTGMYTVKFTGVDLAGNTGATKTRTNVYVDVTDITLTDLLPTNAAGLDTIEETTSPVSFKLSEAADSVIIRYSGFTGPDAGKIRTRRLAGVELTRLTPQVFDFGDSLKNLTQYELTVLARDLAGNYTMSGPDTFLYDTSFVVPIIKRFVVTASKSGLLAASHAVAGDAITLTIKADASTNGTRDAVTYDMDAILRVSGGTGVTLAGTAVTDGGGGRAVLGSAGWVAGIRTVTLKDTTSVDTLAVTVVDSNDATAPYVGSLDSLIVYDPSAYTKILVSAPSSVTQGQAFTVDVTLADKYGNQRVGDTRYVKVSANKVGVESQQGDVLISKGAGSFLATATGFSGDGLVFHVADLVDVNMGATVRSGNSAAVTVAPSGAPPVDPGIALDRPDTLIAQDYMGADGLGDQGGFVLLTWELSSDHGILTGYRIYREMMVDYGVDAEGNVVMLDAPETDWVPWAKVDAVPGEVIGRAVVATLDNVATHWAIAAERGTSTTAKEAFDQDADMSTPYELMAATMVESKKAADLVDGVQIATLSPEALAFIENGVVPRMKSVDTEMVLSDLTPTVNAVRAIDNIAPAAVAVMRAKDTPSDAGSSITVTWSRSESDQMVQRSFPNAVGLHGVSDQVAGVMGYNVYRSVGDAAPALVGKAPSGATSFADQTAINGVRYTYTVRPYDSDNEAPALVAQTTMAVRNNVFAEDGTRIYGLFGMDSVVGFDDFFIFADNFGMSAADEAFDAAFDLVPDAKVDFEDFFLFADSFGRVARVAGKVVPTVAGLNADARMYLDASAELPAIGEEVAIAVDLADYVELKGYGFSVQYDAEVLEFVGVKSSNSLLGEGELAAPRVISQTDGEVSIAAYGETVSEGSLDVSVVFRTKAEIENTFVDVTESEVRDGNYAVNQLALPAPVQIQTRPEAFALRNNYPNPFNPSTTIKYALPEASFVQLQVYNVVGQVVRTLVADHQNAGRYVVQWDASDDSGHSLSSGIYFYRLQAGDQFLEVKKMLLLK